jgi:hypothetical protein
MTDRTDPTENLMHRTSRPSLVAAALLALLAPLAFTVTDAQATTGSETPAAPELRLFTVPNPNNPIRVAAYDEENPPAAPEECIADSGDNYDEACYNVGLSVEAVGTLTDVTVTVTESEGLYVDPMVTTYDTIEDGRSEFVRFAVRATTTGLHTLTLEITATGAETRTISLPYLWRSGGAPLPGGDSLAGRMYGQNFRGSYPCTPSGTCDFRYSERLVFKNAKRASTALAVKGRPVCGPGGKCPRYHYDKSTGLFQVGRFIIGRVTKNATWIDGARYQRMKYARPGKRLNGNWSYGDNVDEGRGIVEQSLELRPNGRFKLSYFVDNHRYGESTTELTYGRKFAGTYRIGRNGKITFTDPKRKKKFVATLALITNAKGKARPNSKGVWLDLSVADRDGKKFVDGNHLQDFGG